MILVDTNVLYALADRRDKHHARCADWLQRTPDVLMVPATVLAETCYLIDRTLGPTAEAAFLDSVGMGPEYTFQLVDLVDSDLRRMSDLVRQYADLRLGGTDASVVAICERLAIATVATVNLRDFGTVRPSHVHAFITVPGLD
ncbi:MAG TPA: PIN domain-containing protein [Trebonia sp.]